MMKSKKISCPECGQQYGLFSGLLSFRLLPLNCRCKNIKIYFDRRQSGMILIFVVFIILPLAFMIALTGAFVSAYSLLALFVAYYLFVFFLEMKLGPVCIKKTPDTIAFEKRDGRALIFLLVYMAVGCILLK